MIPDGASEVYSSDLLEVYNWDQRLPDGSTEQFESVRRVPTVQVLATRGDRILVLSEDQPSIGSYYGFPGGRAESFDEELRCAAHRELREETGLDGDLEHLFDADMEGVIEWKTRYYHVENPDRVCEADPDAGEQIRKEWVEFDGFVDLAGSDAFRNKGFATRFLSRYLSDDITSIRDIPAVLG